MTVGNQARIQFNAARVQTQYGSQLDSLRGSYLAGRYSSIGGRHSAATQTLNDLLKGNSLKNKDSFFREQFSNLYKSIYGVNDDSSENESEYSSPQSIKNASANAGGAAESIKSFANDLKYNGELDVDAYKAQAQSFVDNYNEFVDKVGNSDKSNVLQKGVLMVNTGKVYSSSLKRAGITVGSDNKLSVNDDLSKVKASDVKNAFGTMGFSDKVIDKSRQINTMTGGVGTFNTPSVKKPESFVDKYNNFVDEMAKSDKSSIQQKGLTLQSTARAYKHQLSRAGITVDANNRLGLKKDMSDITANDVKYAFGYGGFTDKVAQKADQVNALANSASSMGYNSNRAATYAYTTGALYSMYA